MKSDLPIGECGCLHPGECAVKGKHRISECHIERDTMRDYWRYAKSGNACMGIILFAAMIGIASLIALAIRARKFFY